MHGGLYVRGQEPLNRELSHSLSTLPEGFVCPLLTDWNRRRYPGTLRAAGFFCISLGTHRAAVNTLGEIGKPDSGCTADFTSDGQEPLNREHITCSW